MTVFRENVRVFIHLKKNKFQVLVLNMNIIIYIEFLLFIVITIANGTLYQRSNGCGYDVRSLHRINYI
jgi:hypothetical protein